MCLEKLISIRELCRDSSQPNEEPLFYIDDIDISLSLIEKYVGNDSSICAAALFRRKLNAAVKILSADINTHYANTFTNSSYITNDVIGCTQDNMNVISGAAGYNKGIYVELTNIKSNVDFYLSKISLFTDQTVTIPVQVFDVYQGMLLDTIDVECIANRITEKHLNKKYSTKYRTLKLLFIYDSSLANSYLTNYSCSTCGGCGSGVVLNNFVNAKGAIIDSAAQRIESNISYVNETGGMMINYSINCNYEHWLCDNGNILYMPLAYKVAAEIERYALDTDRFNDRAQNKEQRIKERIDYFELKYREYLDGVINKMRLPTDEICFRCNDRIRNVITLP